MNDNNNKAEKKNESNTRDSVGGTVASDAINELASKKNKAVDNAAEFIKKCVESGNDPMYVVSYIADRDKISLSGPEPEDGYKCMMYHLLRDVISNIAIDIFNSGIDDKDEVYGISGSLKEALDAIGDRCIKRLKHDLDEINATFLRDAVFH